jgi:hypothetical protein
MSRTFGNTVSGGIQDISAVLSLLGTQQCELHVGSALRGGGRGGYLYAAITPISIFGSLGVAKAAFTIMFASLPHFGAQRLQHMGLDSTGDAVRMITLKGQCYVAELYLQELLKKHFIRDVQGLRLKIARTEFLSWNLWLMIVSLAVATIGVIPYLRFSIRHDTSYLSLSVFFPLCRVVGGLVCVFSGQFLLQQRIFLILRQRILFRLINDPLKQRTDIKVPTTSIAIWDESIASEVCLFALDKFLHKQDGLKDTSAQQPFIAHLVAALKQLDENLGAFGWFGFTKELVCFAHPLSGFAADAQCLSGRKACRIQFKHK